MEGELPSDKEEDPVCWPEKLLPEDLGPECSDSLCVVFCRPTPWA